METVPFPLHSSTLSSGDHDWWTERESKAGTAGAMRPKAREQALKAGFIEQFT